MRERVCRMPLDRTGRRLSLFLILLLLLLQSGLLLGLLLELLSLLPVLGRFLFGLPQVLLALPLELFLLFSLMAGEMVRNVSEHRRAAQWRVQAISQTTRDTVEEGMFIPRARSTRPECVRLCQTEKRQGGETREGQVSNIPWLPPFPAARAETVRAVSCFCIGENRRFQHRRSNLQREITSIRPEIAQGEGGGSKSTYQIHF